MAKNSRTKYVNSLNKYIWSLKGKCESICDLNKDLITQYCRFSALAEEASVEISNNLENLDEDTLDALIRRYEKFNKIVLNLYKTLKFESIKDDLADFGNPYTALLQKAEDDGDF